MAGTWQMKVSAVATADDAQVRIAEAVRSEVAALCSDLQDRANAGIAVERLASPSVDPVAQHGPIVSGESSSEFTDWLVTVAVHDGPDAVVEMRLLDLCERLGQDIEDVALVELTRSVERRVQHVGRVDVGYRIVASVKADASTDVLSNVRTHLREAGHRLREPFEIRGFGWVNLVWHSLPHEQVDHPLRSDQPASHGWITVGEIVIDEVVETFVLGGLLEDLCHQIADDYNHNDDFFGEMKVLTVRRGRSLPDHRRYL